MSFLYLIKLSKKYYKSNIEYAGLYAKFAYEILNEENIINYFKNKISEYRKQKEYTLVYILCTDILNLYDEDFLYDEINLVASYIKDKNLLVNKVTENRLNSKNLIAYKLSNILLKNIDETKYINSLYYEICIIAFYINKKDEGEIACQKLLTNKEFSYDLFNNIRNNLTFYIKTLPVLKRIKIPNEKLENYEGSSASIINKNNGFILNLRKVNYEISSNGSYLYRDNSGKINTRNFLIELNENYEMKKYIELIDKTEVKKYTFYISGFEDVRIFENYFFATSLEHNDKNQPKIVWGTYNLNGEITRVVPLEIYNTDCEKNWLPFIKNNEIYFIYSMEPFRIFKLDKDTGKVELIIEKNLDYNLRDFRGSGAPIVYENGYLFTIHEVVYSNPRKYLHRFVYMDIKFENIKFTDLFCFENPYIEYTLGLTSSNNKIIICYSKNDAESTLAEVSFEQVNSMLNI